MLSLEPSEYFILFSTSSGELSDGELRTLFLDFEDVFMNVGERRSDFDSSWCILKLGDLEKERLSGPGDVS